MILAHRLQQICWIETLQQSRNPGKLALQLRDELMGCVALEPASFLHSGYLYFSFTTTTYGCNGKYSRDAVDAASVEMQFMMTTYENKSSGTVQRRLSDKVTIGIITISRSSFLARVLL